MRCIWRQRERSCFDRVRPTQLHPLCTSLCWQLRGEKGSILTVACGVAYISRI